MLAKWKVSNSHEIPLSTQSGRSAVGPSFAITTKAPKPNRHLLRKAPVAIEWQIDVHSHAARY